MSAKHFCDLCGSDVTNKDRWILGLEKDGVEKGVNQTLKDVDKSVERIPHALNVLTSKVTNILSENVKLVCDTCKSAIENAIFGLDKKKTSRKTLANNGDDNGRTDKDKRKWFV